MDSQSNNTQDRLQEIILIIKHRINYLVVINLWQSKSWKVFYKESINNNIHLTPEINQVQISITIKMEILK